MKKFILKQWYPSLPNGIEVGHIIEFDRKANLPNGDEAELYLLRRKPTTFIMERELHPDFWELIEEENPKPLFITDDGVEVFDRDAKIWVVTRWFDKAYSKASSYHGYLEKESLKSFFHEPNANEYIWRNKRVFSYEDMMKAKHSIILTDEDIEKAAKKRSEQTAVRGKIKEKAESSSKYEAEKIDGRCPKCGGKLEYSHIDRILLSNPPQRQVNCTKCAHVGYLTIERNKQ